LKKLFVARQQEEILRDTAVRASRLNFNTPKNGEWRPAPKTIPASGDPACARAEAPVAMGG